MAIKKNTASAKKPTANLLTNIANSNTGEVKETFVPQVRFITEGDVFIGLLLETENHVYKAKEEKDDDYEGVPFLSANSGREVCMTGYKITTLKEKGDITPGKWYKVVYGGMKDIDGSKNRAKQLIVVELPKTDYEDLLAYATNQALDVGNMEKHLVSGGDAF